jgi:hypothetical protein
MILEIYDIKVTRRARGNPSTSSGRAQETKKYKFTCKK